MAGRNMKVPVQNLVTYVVVDIRQSAFYSLASERAKFGLIQFNLVLGMVLWSTSSLFGHNTILKTWYRILLSIRCVRLFKPSKRGFEGEDSRV